jgi:uncharacterized protein (DUF433 family)
LLLGKTTSNLNALAAVAESKMGQNSMTDAPLDKMDSFTRWKETRTKSREAAVEPWRFLVRRQHPWRMQLYLQGRNLTARQLVGAIKANQWDDEAAAQNYDLPLEAIREALTYVELNRELLETEAEIERLMCKRQEVSGAPQPVSR